MAADAAVRAAAVLSALVPANALAQEILLWGVEVEQLEYRAGNVEDAFAWDAEAFVGDDELKLKLRSKAEYGLDEEVFETLEHQVRLQTPISDFFDAKAGVRLDTPGEGTGRVHGIVGVEGLAPQWFEIDADLFVSAHPSFRLEAEYEALLTNRLVLVPSVEIDLPFTDDEAFGFGAFGPKLELGARLGYDLVDRLLTPYVGVHYERLVGESAALAKSEGEPREGVFFVVGTRILF